MLKFFRTIRRKLLVNNKIGQYLKYALGEIFLVVVGILIALQVNNWNENRKESAKCIEILRELKENIISNSMQFQEEIEMEEKTIASIDVVLNNINNVKVYEDSLDKHFHLSIFWPTSVWKISGYEALKSHGVDLIKSKELRESIIELFEISYPGISEIIRNSENYSYTTLVPTFSDLFYIKPTAAGQSLETFEAKPMDYGKVLSSQKLIGALSFWRLQRVYAAELRQNSITKNQMLIELIERKLGSK